MANILSPEFQANMQVMGWEHELGRKLSPDDRQFILGLLVRIYTAQDGVHYGPQTASAPSESVLTPEVREKVGSIFEAKPDLSGAVLNFLAENPVELETRLVTAQMDPSRLQWYKNNFPVVGSNGPQIYVIVDDVHYEMDELSPADKDALLVIFPSGPQSIS